MIMDSNPVSPSNMFINLQSLTPCSLKEFHQIGWLQWKSLHLSLSTHSLLAYSGPPLYQYLFHVYTLLPYPYIFQLAFL